MGEQKEARQPLHLKWHAFVKYVPLPYVSTPLANDGASLGKVVPLTPVIMPFCIILAPLYQVITYLQPSSDLSVLLLANGDPTSPVMKLLQPLRMPPD